MDPKKWTNDDGDQGRIGRLSAGFAMGVLCMSGLLAFLTVAGGNVTEMIQKEEDIVDVQLAKTPEPEPEPEVEEEVDPEPAPRAAGPVMPKLVVPKEIPKEAPKETDAPVGDTNGTGDPYANAGGGGRGKGTGKAAPKPTAEPSVEKPKPPPPKPEKKKVFRANEVAVQPVAQNRPYPSYPSSARSAGIEGVVVVRYVITESGSTAAVKAVRGPPELTGVCEAAVQSWTFTPARNEAGQAVPVVKFARFPFKIKI